MDFLKLDNAGGLLLYQDHLKKMQQNIIDAVRHITNNYGQYVILDGCTVTGSNVSNGVVIYDGEVMPFTGGVKNKVAVTETSATTGFVGNVQKNFYYTRTAVAGASGVTFDSFKRISKLSAIYDDVLTYINAIKRDDINLNDSTKLATSKAVHDLNQRVNSIIYKGSETAITIENPGTEAYYGRVMTVTHNLGLYQYTVDQMKIYLTGWGWVSMEAYAIACENGFVYSRPYEENFVSINDSNFNSPWDGFYDFKPNSFKMSFYRYSPQIEVVSDILIRRNAMAFWISKMPEM